MKDIILEAAELIKQNKPAALCTVVETNGSSPRKAESKMLVFSDGSIKGTIGGGAVEKQAIAEALKVLANGNSILLKYNLKNDLKMECGGSMQIFIECLAIKPQLCVFGAGHVGKAFVSMALNLGFRVKMIDERQGIFDSYTQNPDLQFFNEHFTDFIARENFDDNTYIVILTHQHINDFAVLRLVCNKPHAYLGMIGSKIKVAEAEKALLDEKILPAEKIKLIDMPIGVPIKSETPEEIAVSILAKIIDVKNKK